MTGALAERVVAEARAWLGTPYHDQMSVRGAGCDCLGLVRGVWRATMGAEPPGIPTYSRGWGETGRTEVLAVAARAIMTEIAPRDIRPGAVVMFRMRRGVIAKHLGIVTAPGRFIHAYDRCGVIEQALTEPWRRRIAFAFVFPGAG